MVDPRPCALAVVWRYPVVSETFVTDHLRAMLEGGWRVALCCEQDDDLAAGDDVLPRLDRVSVLGRAVTDPSPVRLAGRAVREGQWRAP